MSTGFPSMTALLGLIAVAGYQNRDKLAEMIGGQSANAPAAEGSRPQEPVAHGGGLSSVIGNLTGGLGGASTGGVLANGLRELVDHFQNRGKGDVAKSWVSTGPNQEIAPRDLEAAIGPEVISELVRRTGLSRQELVARLSTQLPSAVDKYTPDGRLPS
jgi:uncharacterized protein YidB (DUF937 family)